MKNLKKIASLLLALVMVFSLAIGASAATVIAPTGHTYKAYQVFSGTQADNSKVLGDIVWGTGVNDTGLLSDLKASTVKVTITGDNSQATETTIGTLFAACGDAKAVAEVLDDYADNSAVAKAFANIAAENIKGNGTDFTETVTLADGYYLFVDVTADVSTNDAHNSALLQVTGDDNIQITQKYTVPSPDKDITAVTHIETKSDFTDTDAVDAEIGDTIEFTLTGTLPTNYDDYESYVYNFHDTLSDGMTYVADDTTTDGVNEGAKVYVVNDNIETEVTDSFTVTAGNNVTCSCGCNLNIACANLKTINGATIDKDSVIKVVYSAKLGSGATIGATGNPNTMYIEYSNNPNKDSDGTPDTGKTPPDEVLVFTYELDVTKIDGATANKETPTKLSGAEFVLLNSDSTKVATVVGGKLTKWVAVPDAVDGTITWPDNTTLKSAETTGLFSITGLDAGTYYLKETKAPAGYNLLTEDVKIEITATVTGDETAGGSLTALNIKVGNATKTTEGVKDTNGKFTGEVAATIENNQGGTLPETGGMGTTLFYVFGGILVAAAVVLLVTKKRVGEAK